MAAALSPHFRLQSRPSNSCHPLLRRRVLSVVRGPPASRIVVRQGSLCNLDASLGKAKSEACRRRRHVRASSGTEPFTSGEPKQSWGGRLEGISVTRTDGTPTPLLSLWRGRKAVVAWVRHFGCLLCRKRAAMLASKKAEMEAAGVALAVIGPGSLEQARAFKEQTAFPGEVFADPDFSSFHAFNFVHGVHSVINPESALRVIQAQAEGFSQDWGLSLQPDTVLRGGWQQGGVLVAGPTPEDILFLHRDKQAGDEPSMDDVVSACCGSVSARTL